MSDISNLIDILNADVKELNKFATELKNIEGASKGTVSVEVLRKIKKIRQDISNSLSKLYKASEKSKKEADKLAVQEYISRVEVALDSIVAFNLGQGDQFSADYDAYWIAMEKHLAEMKVLLELRKESEEDSTNTDYFSVVGKTAISRINKKTSIRKAAHKKLQKDYLSDVAIFKKQLNESFKKAHSDAKQIRKNLPTAAWFDYESKDIPNVGKLHSQIQKLTAALDSALEEFITLRYNKDTLDNYYGERGILLMKYIEALENQIDSLSSKLSNSYATEVKIYNETEKQRIYSGNDVSGAEFDIELWNKYQKWKEVDQKQDSYFTALKSDLAEKKKESELHANFEKFVDIEKQKEKLILDMMKRYKEVIQKRNNDLKRNFDANHKTPDVILKSESLGFIEVSQRDLKNTLEEWIDLFRRADGAFFESRGMVYFVHIVNLQKERTKEAVKMYNAHVKRLKKEEKEAKQAAKLESQGRYLIEDSDGNECYSSSEDGSCSENDSTDDDSTDDDEEVN